MKYAKISIVLPMLIFFLFAAAGCSPKVYHKTYSDREFNPQDIKKLIIVAGDTKIRETYAFSEIFTQTASERKKFFLLHKDYFEKGKLNKSPFSKKADAFLVIALTHIYPGNLSRHLPTTIGANAKLIEAKTGKMVWNTTFSYSSSETGYFAPPIEEAMKIASEKIIDAVPLTYAGPPISKARLAKTQSKKMSAGKNKLLSETKTVNLQPAKRKVNPSSLDMKKETSQKPSERTVSAVKPVAPETAVYSIQVGTFRTKRTAENLVSLLIKKGYSKAYLFSKADPNGRMWHAVRFGKFDQKNKALTIAAVFSTKTKIATSVRPVNAL